jgi:hypothetical protein
MENRTYNALLGCFGLLFLIGSILLIKEFKYLSPSSSTTTVHNNQLRQYTIEFSSGFIPGQRDDWDIIFPVPNGMREDAEMTRQKGAHKVFVSAGNRVDPNSIIVITFNRRRDARPLSMFVEGYIRRVREYLHQAEISAGKIDFPEEYLRKYRDLGIDNMAIAFMLDDPQTSREFNAAIFFFETPGGYWSVCWFAPRRLMLNESSERRLFVDLVGHTMIGIKRPETNSMELHY